jgi:putative iron-dependent peroxidase
MTSRAPGELSVVMQPEPQPVLTPLTAAAIFLVLDIAEGGEPVVRDLLTDLAGLQRSVGFRYLDGGLASVVSVGSAAWDRLFDGPRPAYLHPFRELVGRRHRAVATSGDLLLHIRANEMFLCFELARLIMVRLASAVTVVDEVHGFKYFDERDLLGFVDGTENPTDLAAARAITVTATDDPDFVGSSYVIVQKYLHDLVTWDALSTEEQERVIGRTKLSDVELADEIKPTNSHVALNTVTGPDGEERQILRDNMPFGDFGRGEFGTYFIGYASTPELIEQMLSNMFIGSPLGNYDRVLDFSTAVTGSLFFTPTATFLDDLPPMPSGNAPVGSAAEPLTASPTARSIQLDTSLGIGSLKRSSTP